MATTYLEACNEILSESNEVQLTSSNFASAIGVHGFVKNIINRSYLELCAEEEEWPFLAAADSNTNEPFAGNVSVDIVSGTRWYLLKTGSTDLTEDYAKVDWDSFFLTTEGASGASAPYEYIELKYTPYDQWTATRREVESEDAGNEQNYAIPSRVIESSDGRFFGLSGIPNKNYVAYFNAWVQPSKLTTDSQELLVPDMYLPVVLHKARYYMNMFKKDYQEATLAERAYEKSLRKMSRGLIGNQSDYMRDDRTRI